MRSRRLLLLLLVAAAVAAFFLSGAGDYLALEVLQAEQARFQAWLAREPVTVIGGFFLLYVAMAALSLPGATLMTVLSGALFGLGGGLMIVSFASALGATLAALIARTLLRGPLERRYAGVLERVNAGIRREGALYLFTLRLIPLFPFFVINLVMGLTRMRLTTFYWVSQVGMLPGTAVFVNAGRELGELQALGDILSPSLLVSFALIGLFPWLAKWLVALVKRRALARRYARPARFDRDIVVIGAGAAGLVASYIAAAVGARVTLVEREKMGGDCLNTGCVPSKALIRAARSAREVRRAGRYGVQVGEPCVDFAAVMGHVHGAIEAIAPHDSVERYTGLGVEVLKGEARLASPWEVSVATPEGPRTLTTRHVIIASGARPRVPELPGIDAIEVLTSDTLWRLEALPERLVVLGGGPIGCELGQSFALLGSRVTLVESAGQLLPREDAEVAEALLSAMGEDGVRVLLGQRALEVVTDATGPALEVANGEGQRERLPFTHLLVAVGREADVSGMGLEALGVETRANGTLDVDETLRSMLPNVWACGDVAGPYQLTHAGAHQAWHATVNALFGEVRRFRVSYRALPAVTFTTPEVARVGLNEREAHERGVAYEVTRYDLAELDRALAEGDSRGFVKVLTTPGRDRILGATVVGEGAGEMLATFTLAMTRGIGLNRLLSTIHPYPTRSEAVKATAGVWKNAHKPERLLGWLARYFAWRRGGERREKG
ncbi:bifunctional TVP38/TMEM64 family protein/FAD-dependent oxidoreductase [Halomonas sp. JS92-SW72]|uniref:FAD-dependent oxidoreductase n=1 Tax=Halomonas sp. JS92-SW72 TaxID=2306583 RepID=UPI000E5AABD5|nr:bifunctional TVP38/TMEM64 family protein/FAD-dependent oxidoreductase [Halomonas sp. JS92-SW72]AXY42327.1 pyridine nucleotide-disulfide oxidoreductase [Halomonas sp. JS92-SW72]